MAIILGAFALRLNLLDHVSLRGDESFTVLFVENPFAEMWQGILTIEPNPPLLYLLLRGWISVAGAGEFATRYFSVFWGVLCVALLYRFAREFFRLSNAPRERIALAAALLIAINPYQIWHSQDVRNYTMWPALSLLALLFFWQWRNRIKADGYVSLAQSSIIPFVAAELAALYTHYYEAFVLVALNLYVLFFFVRRRRELWRRGIFALQSPVAQWVGAQVALALLYLPFPLVLSNRVSSYGEGSGKQGVMLWEIWRATFSSFVLGETLSDAVRNLAWVPLAIALAVILFLFWRREQRGVFLLLWAGVPTLAVFGLNLFRPLFLERYLNGIAPVYYLLFA
ncbi:MAG: glycosyltransferase family 39 protein, partial [Anaerolineae bacterium]